MTESTRPDRFDTVSFTDKSSTMEMNEYGTRAVSGGMVEWAWKDTIVAIPLCRIRYIETKLCYDGGSTDD